MKSCPFPSSDSICDAYGSPSAGSIPHHRGGDFSRHPGSANQHQRSSARREIIFDPRCKHHGKRATRGVVVDAVVYSLSRYPC